MDIIHRIRTVLLCDFLSYVSLLGNLHMIVRLNPNTQHMLHTVHQNLKRVY
jgi:hypothetical protein